MKKKIIATFFALSAGLLLFAAGNQDSVVTIEGKLVVIKGVPTVVSGDKAWVLPAAPFYQIAWENGVKVGDAIKAEGYVMDGHGAPDNSSGTMFLPTKVWVNGKEIDLSTVRGMMGPGMGKPGNGPGRNDDRNGSRDNQRFGKPGNDAEQ